MNVTLLKIRRVAMGETANRVADSAGISRVTLSRIENGKHEPRDTTKTRIANALGLPVGYLFPEGRSDG